ncbi:hypothetical protein PMI01_00265 [Caulobacter sp. AP07]|nr:hypothetical protein [Caulobacter sp. AP07]EJL38090.1 hypothetical protein PMI01_00265 [Caulobacter sp. AP07]
MGHVVRDVAFRARISRQQVRPSGLLVVTVVTLILWAGLAMLIIRAI